MFKIAVKFIRYEKSKSIGIIVGIIIAVFLIGQQLSTLGFLTHLMSAIVRHSNPNEADIWVITNESQNANLLKPISVSLVNRLKSINGVTEAYPVVVGQASMMFDNGKFSPVLIIGSQVSAPVIGLSPQSVVAGSRTSLQNIGSFSLDESDAKLFNHTIKVGMHVEINGKTASITALTKNIKGYGNSFMYTSIDNARQYVEMPNNHVSAVILHVANKAKINQVIQNINSTFVNVHAWRRQDLIDSTQNVIMRASNIAVSFSSLVGFAVISGFFIIGLTLYTSTLDRVKDYGTVKAMGGTNRYISKLVFLQALIYGIVGYVIALILLFFMKVLLAKVGLMLVITPLLLFLLLMVTLVISVGGSFFATIKLVKLELATVFK